MRSIWIAFAIVFIKWQVLQPHQEGLPKESGYPEANALFDLKTFAVRSAVVREGGQPGEHRAVNRFRRIRID